MYGVRRGLKNLKRELYIAKATNVKIPPNLPLKKGGMFHYKASACANLPFEKGELYARANLPLYQR